MTTLTLHDDTYYCVANGRMALLDLRDDRYFALPPSCDEAFRSLICGQMLTDAQRQALAPLIARHIIVVRPDGFIQKIPPSPPTPMRSYQDTSANGVRVVLFGSALGMQMSAAIQLKTRHLSDIIADIRRRKHEHVLRHRPPEPEALASFLMTRRLVGTQDRCLRWSIAMVNYLAARDCYPSLVLGVKMTPFSAHAWVQLDDLVLNDGLDQVLPYTPILVV